MESPCSWPENSTSDRAKAVEELIKGRHSALQLRCLLNKLSPTSSADNNNNNNNQDLVLNILTSFTNTLSILTNGGGDHHQYYQSDELSQIQTNATHFSWEARKSEDSGDSCKSTSIVKDRRGCYKRRKCSNSWIRESPNLIDDGYAWRKYGQKVILKAKYPRNYFRCTHKHDQGCLATKQVQRIQDDPPLFRTTYSGHHTCKNLLKASQLFMDSKDHNSPMISFCDKETTINNNNNHPFLSSFPSIKHEHKDDQEIIMPSHDDHHRHDPMTSHNYQSESSDHYLLSPDDHQMTAYDSGVVNSSSLSCTDMGVMVVDSVVNVNFHDDDLLHQFDF